MKLKQLRIEAEKNWKTGITSYVGKIEFGDERGSVNLTLTPEQCDKLFVVVGDGLIETARVVAKEMTTNLIEHQQLLEGVLP